MSKVQHVARLHERTLQAIATGALNLPRQQRSHTTTSRWELHVHPDVMRVVRRVRRPGTILHIINEAEVLIVNRKEQKWHSE